MLIPPILLSGIGVHNLVPGDVQKCLTIWAKLLDMLSERFGILFLVSAGNVTSPLPVPGFSTWTAFEDASTEDRERAIMQGLSEQKSQRTLLSPAEGLNVVTVGAWHEDSVPDSHQNVRGIDPFSGSDLPNVSSALGLGHRKVIKPELHLPGGRERLTFLSTGSDLVVGVAEAGRQYGLKAAIPDAAGALDREGLTNGTSAATALATRAAHRMFEALLDRDGGSLHADDLAWANQFRPCLNLLMGEVVLDAVGRCDGRI